ncbi:MAG: hypothetical protein AB7P07_11810 [Hyphomonadaceae bacterium]
MRLVLFCMAAAGLLASCESLPAPRTDMPRELIDGRASMIIRPVEPEVSREEVSGAVQRLIDGVPVCLRWPAIWSEPAGIRSVVARFDLMTRDWGEPVSADAEARLDEFVEMGLLVKTPREDRGPGAAEYTLTDQGRDYLRGAFTGRQPPSFCGPSGRRVIEIVSMEWGDYPCGTLRTRFSHVADAWPAWISSSGARARIADWPTPGSGAQGTVTLGRLWYREEALPANFERNGALGSVCYDSARRRALGDDFRLFADQPAPEAPPEESSDAS